MKDKSLINISNSINSKHQAVLALGKNILRDTKKALAIAIECGVLLTRAKDKFGYGKYGEWFKEHIKFNMDTAARYMRLAENKSKLIAAESIRQAYLEIGIWKEPVKYVAPDNPNDSPKLSGKIKGGESLDKFASKLSPKARDELHAQLGVTPSNVDKETTSDGKTQKTTYRSKPLLPDTEDKIHPLKDEPKRLNNVLMLIRQLVEWLNKNTSLSSENAQIHNAMKPLNEWYENIMALSRKEYGTPSSGNRLTKGAKVSVDVGRGAKKTNGKEAKLKNEFEKFFTE